MSEYKARRDKAAEDEPETNGFKSGADWARADLMKQVEEILVKALRRTQDVELWSSQRSLGNPEHLRKLVHNGYVIATDALIAWQAIKESDNG